MEDFRTLDLPSYLVNSYNELEHPVMSFQRLEDRDMGLYLLDEIRSG